MAVIWSSLFLWDGSSSLWVAALFLSFFLFLSIRSGPEKKKRKKEEPKTLHQEEEEGFEEEEEEEEEDAGAVEGEGEKTYEK